MKSTTFVMSFYFLQIKTLILLVARHLNINFVLLLLGSYINGRSRKILMFII